MCVRACVRACRAVVGGGGRAARPANSNLVGDIGIRVDA